MEATENRYPLPTASETSVIMPYWRDFISCQACWKNTSENPKMIVAIPNPIAWAYGNLPIPRDSVTISFVKTSGMSKRVTIQKRLRYPAAEP